MLGFSHKISKDGVPSKVPSSREVNELKANDLIHKGRSKKHNDNVNVRCPLDVDINRINQPKDDEKSAC